MTIQDQPHENTPELAGMRGRRRSERGCLFLAVLFSAALFVPQPQSAAQTSLTELLAAPVLAPDTAQDEMAAFVCQHVPGLSIPVSAEAWTKEAGALRQRFLDEIVFRGVPEAWRDPMVQVVWTEDITTDGGYTIRKLRYEALPGLWIPALLYAPDAPDIPAPAVLNVNGHVGPPGKAIEYEQARCINLAKRGIFALHPEWFSFGELQGPDYSHNNLSWLDVCGVSGLSVFYLAISRAVDVLESLPGVDPARLGVTGLSGGGWQTIVLGALDTRLSAIAPNAGYIGLAVRTEHTGDIGDLEQAPYGLLTVGDYTHMTAMLAPRPARLIYNIADDCCFPSPRARGSVFEPIRPFYGLYCADEAFTYHENLDPGTHNYEQDNREAFYQFINRTYLPEAHWQDLDLPWEAEVKSIEELSVGLPEGNATFHTLAMAALENVPETGTGPRDGESPEHWRERVTGEITELLHIAAPGYSADRLPSSVQEGVRFQPMILHVNRFWSVPLVELSLDGATPRSTVVYLAGEGRESLAAAAAAGLNETTRVLLVDPVMMGENTPETGAERMAMLVNATGAPLLGQQVMQVLATAQWIEDAYGPDPIALEATGLNAGVAAHVAAALRPGLSVSAKDCPESLRSLIVDHVSYNESPAVFVFGVLMRFDIPLLKALQQP